MAKKATKSPPRKPKVQPNLEAMMRIAADKVLHGDDIERRRQFQQARPPHGIGETKRNAERERIFLEGLADGYSISSCAWVIGVSRTTAQNWRAMSAATLQPDGTYTDDFCLRWAAAEEAANDRLEEEARRRAVVGVEKPVYQGGCMVGTVTEYSDTLMQTMLKGNRPSKYNTERHELSGPGGGPIAHSMEIEFIGTDGRK